MLDGGRRNGGVDKKFVERTGRKDGTEKVEERVEGIGGEADGGNEASRKQEESGE